MNGPIRGELVALLLRGKEMRKIQGRSLKKINAFALNSVERFNGKASSMKEMGKGV